MACYSNATAASTSFLQIANKVDDQAQADRIEFCKEEEGGGASKFPLSAGASHQNGANSTHSRPRFRAMGNRKSRI